MTADHPPLDIDRLRASVQDANGIAVRVAALEDAIASKEWANRPKDLQAPPELRELASRLNRR